MNILFLNNEDGAYRMQTWPDHLTVPDGWAIVEDNLDKSVFYDHNGYVTLTTEEQVRVIGTHVEQREVDGEIVSETVEDTASVTVVTAWEPDLEAWEAWKATRSTPGVRKPSTTDILNTLLGVTE